MKEKQDRNTRNHSTPDFGKTAKDYATFRQGFPKDFFTSLKAHGLIKRGMKVLDLGTGTGSIARGFAQEGCDVIAVDPADSLLQEAEELDKKANVHIEYRKAAAEDTKCDADSFDVVIAGQSWHWFNHDAAIAEAKRVLKPDGKLIIAHFDWLPIPRTVPDLTEKLILKYNPKWSLGGGTGIYPKWLVQLAEANFSDIQSYSFDRGISYTHEQWRGRIRASAGIGAALDKSTIEKFDQEHAESLRFYFPEEPLIVPHRIFTLFASKKESNYTSSQTTHISF